MGRPPKSIDEHIKEGTYQKCRHENRGITMDALDYLPPPVSLSKRAAEKWDEMVPAIVSAGLVTVVDAVRIKDAFISYDIAQDCLEKVNGYEHYGDYLQNLDKTRQINLLDSYTMYMNRFHKIMDQYGGNPKARATLKVRPKDDDGQDFLKQLMGNG